MRDPSIVSDFPAKSRRAETSAAIRGFIAATIRRPDSPDRR
jgi:hypothetical protein